MRDSLVDETFLDVSLGLRDWRLRSLPADLGFSSNTFRRVGKQVVRILRGHQAGTSQRQGNPAGVYGDPPPPPLLCDVSSGPASAGRIEYEVARICGH